MWALWTDLWQRSCLALRVAADSSPAGCAALRWVLAAVQELERACR